jgi:hypothetical protein
LPDFSDILKSIDKAIEKFNSKIPAAQKRMYEGITDELKRLDTNNGKIKTTVANLKIIQSIKNKLTNLVVTPEYLKDVKEFASQFNTITKLQNEYWRSVEKKFTPRALLKEVRKQTISDTVKGLTSSGIGSAISDQIAGILRTNITTGGSYSQLTEQLREKILNTKTDGALAKYAKQITTDSLNQYSAQYTQTVSSDLGYEWFAYAGSDIVTTRPFCDAMTDLRYFHITEIPRLLRAEGLYYNKDGDKTKVPIYAKTDLPHGMIPGTNAANFQINRGGYNCGHQIRPVSERLVPFERQQEVMNTPGYKRFKGLDEAVKMEEKQEKLDVIPASKKEETALVNIEKEEARIEEIIQSDIVDYDLDLLLNDSNNSFGLLMKPDNKRINRLLEEYPEMKREEIVAIDMYGNTTYRKVNGILRHEAQDEFPFEKNFEKLMNKGLDKLPDFTGTVYRGGNFDRITLDAYKDAFKTGKAITEKGFTSTSQETSSAFEGDTFFIIKSKTGKPVDKIMELGNEGPSEAEVIFRSGTKFKVTEYKTEKVTKTYGGYSETKKRTLIKMEEI